MTTAAKRVVLVRAGHEQLTHGIDQAIVRREIEGRHASTRMANDALLGDLPQELLCLSKRERRLHQTALSSERVQRGEQAVAQPQHAALFGGQLRCGQHDALNANIETWVGQVVGSQRLHRMGREFAQELALLA